MSRLGIEGKPRICSAIALASMALRSMRMPLALFNSTCASPMSRTWKTCRQHS